MPDSYTTAEGDLATLSTAGRATAAVGIWMATWWLTEAVEIPVTALLPVAVLPLVGAASVTEAAAPYAHELIFLFLGGFMLALSLQRWALDERIALLTLRFVGDRPRNIVAGVMLVTAVLSMWVSNTATVAMMLPIVLSVGGIVERAAANAHATGTVREEPVSIALLLGAAYAASIGGMGTIIGTPPNLFVVSFIRDRFGYDIAFAQWMLVALPIVALFLPLGWLLLTRVLYPVSGERLPGAREMVAERTRALGPVDRGEQITLGVFSVTAVAWMTRPLLTEVSIAGAQPLEGLTDAGIAMVAAIALFVLSVNRRSGTFTMDWSTARALPWGILLLFGGGLSLAAAIDRHGLSEFIGHQAQRVGGLPVVLVVAVVAGMVILLTELTSNTATTAVFAPILAAVAPGIGVEPVMLIIAVALAASAAFMMPVATPPNAIVFGSGKLTIPQMARAGVWMNLLSLVLVTTAALTLVPLVVP